MSIKNKEEYNAYMKEYMLKRYYKRRTMVIEKLGGVCSVCGSNDRLEIDHIDHTNKGFDLGKAFTSMSESRLFEEVAKCQLLCYECHKLKTRKDLAEKFDQREFWEHGTLAGYSHHKCRCNGCKTVWNQYTRDYKRKKKAQSK